MTLINVFQKFYFNWAFNRIEDCSSSSPFYKNIQSHAISELLFSFFFLFLHAAVLATVQVMTAVRLWPCQFIKSWGWTGIFFLLSTLLHWICIPAWATGIDLSTGTSGSLPSTGEPTWGLKTVLREENAAPQQPAANLRANSHEKPTH